MDFKSVKQELTSKLSKRTNNANQEFAFLCAELLHKEKSDLITLESISKKEYKKLNKAVNKRLKGVPLQFIIGYSTFYNVEILESKHTLSPRFETELLVEKIVEFENKESSVLDMCSGSGCIGLALKKAGFEEVTLADKSRKAIKMMMKNARHNQIPVTIIRTDMFEDVTGVFDVIVINPPYIKSGDIKNLSTEVKKYDPRLALDGGEDGLDFYREIAKNAHKYLNINGVLYLEIGKNQEKDIEKLLQNNYKNITIIKDLNDINRIIRAEKC